MEDCYEVAPERKNLLDGVTLEDEGGVVIFDSVLLGAYHLLYLSLVHIPSRLRLVALLCWSASLDHHWWWLRSGCGGECRAGAQ